LASARRRLYERGVPLASWIPAEPPHPPEHRGRRAVSFRFEDVSQDGHVVIEAIPQALGAAWQQVAAAQSAATGRPGPAWVDSGRGVPALWSRVVFGVGGGPASIRARAEAAGSYPLANTAGPDGSPDRLILGMWVDLRAPLGRTHPPQPADAGRPLVAG